MKWTLSYHCQLGLLFSQKSASLVLLNTSPSNDAPLLGVCASLTPQHCSVVFGDIPNESPQIVARHVLNFTRAVQYAKSAIAAVPKRSSALPTGNSLRCRLYPCFLAYCGHESHTLLDTVMPDGAVVVTSSGALRTSSLLLRIT